MELAYIYLAIICGDDEDEPQGAYGSVNAAINGIEEHFLEEVFPAELGAAAEVELLDVNIQQCDELRTMVSFTFLVDGDQDVRDVNIDRLPFNM